MTTEMVDKDDPMSNFWLLAILVFIINTQQVMYKITELIFMTEKANASDPYMPNPQQLWNEYTTTRYAFMSMELLFIVVPLRHNFMLH